MLSTTYLVLATVFTISLLLGLVLFVVVESYLGMKEIEENDKQKDEIRKQMKQDNE